MKDRDEKLELLSNKTNRSYNQTLQLFELCDRDYEKLGLLEVQLKNCFCFYCPGDREEVNNVMQLTPKTDRFKLD
jgi:hypothetical protein